MSDVANRRYVLFMLFLVSMFNYIDRTIISILQVPIKADLGLSDAQLGALTGLSFAILYSTLSLPIARWADTTVRKRLIAASLAIWSGMTALTGLATNYASLVGYRMGVAIGEAGSIPATHSIIADLYPPRSRATALAMWGLSVPAGMAFGYLCAGALAEALGWRTTFAVIGIVGLLLAPLIQLTIREPLRGRFDPPRVAATAPPMATVLRYLWQLRTYRMLIAAAACHGYAYYTVLSWSAPFYTRFHELTLTQASAYLAVITGVGNAVGMYLGGRLSDHFGSRDSRNRLRIVAVALFVGVPCTLLQFLTDSLSVSVAFGTLGATLMMSFYAPIIAVPQLLVPASMRAFTTSVVVLAFGLLGLGLGPFITGLISDLLAARYGLGAGSLRYAISAALIFSLLAAWLFWKASRHLPSELLARDTEEAAERRLHDVEGAISKG
jgi:MFS family permease